MDGPDAPEAARAVLRRALFGSWAALGWPGAAERRDVAEAVDPETLVTLSCALAGDLAELRDALEWWRAAGGVLLNPDRLRRTAALFPSYPGPEPAAVARQPRWAGAPSTDVYLRRLGAVAPPALSAPAAVFLRSRAIVGANVRADACAVLSLRPDGITVADVAAMLGYTAAATRPALLYATLQGWARATPRRERRFHPTDHLAEALAPAASSPRVRFTPLGPALVWLARHVLLGPAAAGRAPRLPDAPAALPRTPGGVAGWVAALLHAPVPARAPGGENRGE
ncbi:MAG TPA: hypothetical protein VGB92_10830 [Longimicrobium sp.]|jgi:hypothetical protein